MELSLTLPIETSTLRNKDIEMKICSGDACSILVVDDEPSILRMIGRVLLETGCQLYTAGTAEDAMQLVDTAEPDLVIADIRLPGMSGTDLASEIKRDRPDTPVLLISAYREPENHDADDFLGKPFDNEELVDRVQSLLNGAAPQTQARRPGPEVRF
jgi:DNA-binding response OmpR family regulator